MASYYAKANSTILQVVSARQKTSRFCHPLFAAQYRTVNRH